MFSSIHRLSLPLYCPNIRIILPALFSYKRQLQPKLKAISPLTAWQNCIEVLTRMPSQPRISPQDAQRLSESHLQYLEPVVLDKVDYQAAMALERLRSPLALPKASMALEHTAFGIAQMTQLNLVGGGIFAALIAQAALKSAADRLLTLNPKHFYSS